MEYNIMKYYEIIMVGLGSSFTTRFFARVTTLLLQINNWQIWYKQYGFLSNKTVDKCIFKSFIAQDGNYWK